MTDKGMKCRCCDHTERHHKMHPGFYDVRSYRGECLILGCGCMRFEA